MDIKKLKKYLNWNEILCEEKLTEKEIRDDLKIIKEKKLLGNLVIKQSIHPDLFMEIFSDLSPKQVYDALDFQKYDLEKEESLHLFLKLHGYETGERGVTLSKGKWDVNIKRITQQKIITFQFDDQKLFNSIVGKDIKLAVLFLRGNSWYGNVLAVIPLLEKHDYDNDDTRWVPDADEFVNSLHDYIQKYAITTYQLSALTIKKPEREKLVDKIFSVKNDTEFSDKERADIAILVETAINFKFFSMSEFSKRLREICEIIKKEEF
jgi:hypothetical protein